MSSPSPSPQADPFSASDQQAHSSSPDQAQSSPITTDTGSDTILISTSPHSLHRTHEPAHTLPASERDRPASPTTSQRASGQRPTNTSSTSYSSPAWEKPSLTRQSTSNEPKKCWICFGDSTEDGPETSAWRTPCPCALTAHEACLLDWIADLEAPPASTSQSARRRKNKIQCPQCKSEIRVARPWSPIVAGIRAVERVTGTLVLPGVAGMLFGGVFSACFVHGAISAMLVLGPEDWAKLTGAASGGGPIKAGFRLTLGLPMIPVVLVLSRTRMADNFLPVLPLLFLAPDVTLFRHIQRVVVGSAGQVQVVAGPTEFWPPNAATAFASLPYLRTFYNAAFASLFAAKQKKWLKAVQREPRPGEEEDDEEREEEDAGAAMEEDDLEIEVNAEIQFGDEGELADPEGVQQAIDDAVQAAEARNAHGRQNAAGANEQRRNAEHARPAPQPRRNPQQAAQQNQGLVLSANRIADTVLGALCFPAIAALMGEAMKMALPEKWTASPLVRRSGLLQTRWGRSIIGGCLFVVMKDALVLYSQYRTAQDHSKRHVLDYKGPSTRKRGRAA